MIPETCNSNAKNMVAMPPMNKAIEDFTDLKINQKITGILKINAKIVPLLFAK